MSDAPAAAQDDAPMSDAPDGNGTLAHITAALNHPSLVHTRVLHAAWNGEALPKPNGNNLTKLAHIRAYRHLGSLAALKAATHAPSSRGAIRGRGVHVS